MDRIYLKINKWEAEFIPHDGCRIATLRFDKIELLTKKPDFFTPPPNWQGEYETRPVYGYDDCFPSVNQCVMPEFGLTIRDHGQLCWQPWNISINDNKAICDTNCKITGADVIRKLVFVNNSLTWQYHISNNTKKDIFFLYVVHPLMPVSEISNVEIAPFEEIVGIDALEKRTINTTGEIGSYLKRIPKFQYRMFFLLKLKEGFVRITFNKGIRLTIEYDNQLFPNMGVWWNNFGYPISETHFRGECAFEPVPGINSNLEKNYNESTCHKVSPGETFGWEIKWKIEVLNRLNSSDKCNFSVW